MLKIKLSRKADICIVFTNIGLFFSKPINNDKINTQINNLKAKLSQGLGLILTYSLK